MKTFLRNILFLTPISISLFLLLFGLFRFLSPAPNNETISNGSKDAVLGESFRPTTNYPSLTPIPKAMLEVVAATPTPEVTITTTPVVNRNYVPRYMQPTPLVTIIPTTIIPVITNTPAPTLAPVACSSDLMVQTIFKNPITCGYDRICRDIVIKPYADPAHVGSEIYFNMPEYEKFGYAIRKDFIEGTLVITVLKVREEASFFYRLNWTECELTNCSSCSLDFTLNTGNWGSGSCFYTSGHDSCEYYPDLNNLPVIN